MIGRTLTHFEILEQLGAGGMGVVYRARDILLDRPVALKLLSCERSGDSERIARFIREAKAASALNHPNIVTVYEIEKTPEGQDFMAMEFIEGETLRALAGKQVSIDMVIRIVRQAAEALKAAHEKGIVHRDIKPENILLRPDGYVKVLDFGLATLPTGDTITLDSARTQPGTVLGTFAYMSPEQARGEAVTPAADVFSLGVVFHELATGSHPFRTHSVVATLSAIQNEPPIAPSYLVPGFPEELERLILQMLGKDPESRPSAAELVEALAPGTAPTPLRRVEPAATSRTFVGRAAEMAELRRSLAAAESGSGLCVFLGGEPGIGKTTLAEEFLAEASDRPLLVARGRCSERIGSGEGYLPLLEALESLLRGQRAHQNGRIMRQAAPSWYALVYSPSRDSLPGPADREGLGAPPERMKRDLVGYFEELTRDQPVVLFLDDLHWADLSTIDMLAHLSGRCPSMRFLILGTFRPTELALAKHPLLPLKQELVARGSAREIQMEFLAAGDISRYIDLNFSGHCFPQEFVELVGKRTEGNPLFVVDLLRELRDEGTLAADDLRHCWQLTRDLSEIAGRIPESVRSLIERKIGRLSEDERRLLAAGAVQGYEFDTAVVAKALQLDAADVEDELGRLEQAHGLIRQVREREMPDGTLSIRYQFVHVLYQNALYDLLKPTRRAALNGAVAEGIIALHGPRHHEQAIELAILFEAARNPARSAQYYLLASRQAAQVSAHEEAIATGRRGLQQLERLPRGPDRSAMETALYLSFGPAMVVARGYADAETEKTYNTALKLTRQSGNPAELFQALLGLSAFYFFRPRLETARTITEQVVGIADQVGDLEILVWANVMRASVLSHTGEFLEARTFGERACACYDQSPQLSHVSRAVHDPGPLSYSQTARVLWILGLADQAMARVRKAVQFGRDSGHSYTLAMALFFLCWLHQHRNEPAEAEVISAETIDLAETRGFVNLRPWARAVHGWAIAESGMVHEGIAEMRAAIDALERAGAGLILPQFLGTLAETLVRSDRAGEALPLIERAFEQAHVSGEHCFDAELLRIKAAGLRTSSPAESEALLHRALELAHRQGALAFELRAAAALAREVRTGEKRAANRALLQSVYDRFTEGFDTPDIRDAAALL